MTYTLGVAESHYGTDPYMVLDFKQTQRTDCLESYTVPTTLDLDDGGHPGGPMCTRVDLLLPDTANAHKLNVLMRFNDAAAADALIARLTEVRDLLAARHPEVEGGTEPPAQVRIDSLIQRVADGEQITVSHPGWNDGNPVDLVELHPRFAGDTEVRYGVRGVFALINATVPADFLVTPA